MPILKTHDEIRALLKKAKTIAVVGLSADPGRDSYTVSAYMKEKGYTIIGVNPKYPELLGAKAYPSLDAIPPEVLLTVDIVNIFRKKEDALAMAQDTARLKLPVLWYQLGLHSPEAVAEADGAGLTVVFDSCIKVAHQLLLR